MVGYSCDSLTYLHLFVEHPYNVNDFTLRFRGTSESYYNAKRGFRDYIIGIFSGMSYLNSCGFCNVDLSPINIYIDSNYSIKIIGVEKCFSVDNKLLDNKLLKSTSKPRENNYLEYRFDIYSATDLIFFLINHFYYGFDLQDIKHLEQGRYVRHIPYQTQVIIRAMLSPLMKERPTFFELAILLNLGHFNLMYDEGKGVSDVINRDYETGNDYLFYLRSNNEADRFHCIIFHWYHGNLERIKRIISDIESKDEFITYLGDYISIYEECIESKVRKRSLYDEFMSLDFDNYRFWLMPPPNLMPPHVESENPANCDETIVENFYRFYDERNRDHEYDSFFDYDKDRFFESIDPKIFNVIHMFSEMKKYISLFYLFVHQDIFQADFHYKSMDESDQDEIFRILERRIFDDKDDFQLQKFMSMIEKLEDIWTESELISRLVNSEKLSDPSTRFQLGIQSIKRLDYVSGKHFIKLAANQGNELAIFYQALLTFHGHLYEKEQEESLRMMIESGRKLKGRYALEVSIILLQGVDVSQDLETGLEMLRIAEPGDEILEFINKGVFHFKISSLYYELLDEEPNSFSHTHDNDQDQMNPKYYFNKGKHALMEKDYYVTEACLRDAINQDYYEAEFIYSLIMSEDEMLDHLRRGAKGGCAVAQVFLGLKLIYGIGCESNREEGLRWLKSAAYQNSRLALEILKEIQSHGFGGIDFGDSCVNDISIDYEALDHKNQLQSASSANNEEISHLWNETIRLLRSPHESIIKECSKLVLNIYTQYTEELNSKTTLTTMSSY